MFHVFYFTVFCFFHIYKKLFWFINLFMRVSIILHRSKRYLTSRPKHLACSVIFFFREFGCGSWPMFTCNTKLAVSAVRHSHSDDITIALSAMLVENLHVNCLFCPLWRKCRSNGKKSRITAHLPRTEATNEQVMR